MITTNIDNNQLLSLDELRDLWNAQADAANSWDALGADEIVWWAQRQALARAGLAQQLNGTDPIRGVPPLLAARDALAEPVTAPAGPTDEELRAVWCDGWNTSEEWGALNFARAVLARFGHHSPDATKMVGSAPPPAEGEVAKLVEWLRQRWPHLAHIPNSDYAMGVRAADLLEQRHPVPVPTDAGQSPA